MRVLVISHLYPAPGLERHLFVHEQVLALARRGAELHVMSPTPLVPLPLRASARHRQEARKPRDARIEGIPVTYPRYPVLPRRILLARAGDFFYLATYRLRAQLRAMRFDLIHAHQALPDGAAAAHWAASLGLPYVVTVHGRDVNFHLLGTGSVTRRAAGALTGADAVMAVSTTVARRLREIVPTAAVTVVRNGVFRSPEQVAPAEFTAHGPLLLSVARLIPSKGVALVLDALALMAAHPDVEYVVIGEGEQETALRRQAEHLGLAARVHFLGQLPHREVLRFMARADLFVLPSAPEGFGLVYAEALSQGTPVVACEGEGPTDFVSHGRNGYLVPPGDVGALVSVLTTALRDHAADTSAMSEATRQSVEELTWDANAERQYAVYEQVLADHGR